MATSDQKMLDSACSIPLDERTLGVLPTPIAVIDSELRLRYANPAFRVAWGIPETEIQGCCLQEVFSTEMAAGIRRIVQQTLSGESAEALFAEPAKERSVRIRCAESEGAAVLAVEISPKRQEAPSGFPDAVRLRTVVDNLPAFIAYYGADLRYHYVNASYQQFFGHPHEWFVGRPVAEVVGADTFALIEPHVKQALSGHAVAFAFQRLEPGGTATAHLRAQYVPDVQADGSVNGLFSLIEDVTARLDAERMAVQEQREKLAIADSLSAMIGSYDSRGRLTYVNQAVADRVGRPTEELIGLTATEAFPAEIATLLEPLVTRALSGERVAPQRSFPVRFRDDEAVGYYELEFTPLFAQDMQRGVVGLAHDVTDRVLREKALATANARLSAAQSAGRLGLWELDVESGAFYWSKPMREIFELEPDLAVTLENFFDFTHPEDIDAVRSAAERSLQSGETVDIEHRVISRSGRVRFVHSQGTVELLENGQPARVVGLTRDITEQRLTQQSLAANEAMLRQITEHTRDVFWLMDAESGELMYLSSSYERLWGRQPSDDFGAIPWLEHVHADDRRQVLSHYADMRRDGHCSAEYRILLPDNEVRWVFARAVPIRDEGADFRSIAGFVEDITESKRMADLQRLKDEAEHASKAKTEFHSNIGHELRTPLNTIFGFAQLMLRDTAHQLAEPQRHHVSEILQATRHLLSVVEEMLDLSRIELGHLRVHFETLAVEELMSEAISMVKAFAQTRNVVLEATLPPFRRLLVRADRTRVRQVLLNLLTNAIKYNTAGGAVRILYELEADMVCIGIEDEGAGLSDAELGTLFRPFQRLESGPDAPEGTGLGLALSQQIAGAMGGAIDVDSTPGSGSVFWLTLPRAFPMSYLTVDA
jgi:PAS domain S-box-containing protein